MLKSQLSYGHLEKFSIHWPFIEILFALGTFLGISIMCIFMMNLEAVFTKYNITFVAFLGLNNNMLTNNTLKRI